jgi:hypothetical protein
MYQEIPAKSLPSIDVTVTVTARRAAMRTELQGVHWIISVIVGTQPSIWAPEMEVSQALSAQI